MKTFILKFIGKFAKGDKVDDSDWPDDHQTTGVSSKGNKLILQNTIRIN